MRKRVLASLLALCMLVAMIPAALAAGSDAFADVPATAWYHDEVEYVVENGLMNGTSSTTFRPDAVMTRAMIATILYRLEGQPAVSAKDLFTDVGGDAYYVNAAAWAASNGIVTANADATFQPNGAVTREQLAAIFYAYAQYKGYDTTALADVSAYADAASISSSALTAVQWAVEAGLLNGTSAVTLSPSDYTTRAQAAAILSRFCNEVVAQEDTHTVTFNFNYTGAEDDRVVTVKDGKTVSAPANPARGGYRFLGWYTQAVGGSKFDFSSAITKDITLYAHWSTTGGSSSKPAEDVIYDNGDPADVANIVIPGVEVAATEEGEWDVITMTGSVATGDLDDLTDFDALKGAFPSDGNYTWADDIAVTYAYFKLPDGATHVNFNGQASVPAYNIIELDNQTIDGQTVEIDGDTYYKMAIQFANKTVGDIWRLSVGTHADNIVEYEFTAGTYDGTDFTVMETYNLKLDYSNLTIVDESVSG